jgi:hypothetical protein
MKASSERMVKGGSLFADYQDASLSKVERDRHSDHRYSIMIHQPYDDKSCSKASIALDSCELNLVMALSLTTSLRRKLRFLPLTTPDPFSPIPVR